MNIKSEYKDFLEKGHKYVSEYLHKQKEDISKKIYLINVLNVINTLERIFPDIKQNMNSIDIKNHCDFEDGDSIRFKLFDKRDEEISKYSTIDELNKMYKEIDKAFNFYFDSDYVSEKLGEDQWVRVYVDKQFIETIFDLLLNDSLKKVLMCAKLENELIENEIKPINKKI